MPDGARDYPAAPVVGVAVMVRRDDRFLLVKRGRPPNEGLWGFPGGRQELDETIEAAAIRELMEETGIAGTNGRFVTALDVIDRDGCGRVRYHYTVLVMHLEWLEGDGVAGDDAAAVGWFSLAEIDTMPTLPATRGLMTSALEQQR